MALIAEVATVLLMDEPAASALELTAHLLSDAGALAALCPTLKPALELGSEPLGAFTLDTPGDHRAPLLTEATTRLASGAVVLVCTASALLAAFRGAITELLASFAALLGSRCALRLTLIGPRGTLALISPFAPRTLRLAVALRLLPALFEALFEAFADALAELFSPFGSLRAVLLLRGLILLLSARGVGLGRQRGRGEQRDR